ncbi:MAG: ABC transporter permease [Candidatus Dormibacteria bacterium]
MSNLALVGRQVTYEQRSFWRNPASAFFTFVFPIMFLIILGSVFRTGTVQVSGRTVASNEYYIPTLVAFGIMGSCFTNIAISMSIRRDTGVLKRLRGTPLPPWALMCGLIGSSVIISLILVGLTTAFGMLVYGVSAPRHIAALALALATGAMCFCVLGLAMSALIPNADAAPAIVNVVFLPLVFISGTFFVVPTESFFTTIARLFPVRHFTDAVLAGFDPAANQGQGLAGMDLLVVAVWGLAGILVTVRWFRWEPVRH